MLRINTTSLYNLGKTLHPLEAFDRNDRPYSEVFFTLFNVRQEVEAIVEDQSLSLRTCRQAARQLVESINVVVPVDMGEMFKHDQAASVGWWQLRQVQINAARFETVLTEELGISDTYAITQKGAYSTTELITNAEVMLPITVIHLLPPKSIEDLREAGKCLAYDTPTAAGFHIVRAIEAAIIGYYAKILNRSAPTRMRNWAVYINALRDSGKADVKVLDLLVHIKDNYRNPISHPDAILSTDEVLVLFSVAVGAMTQIATALGAAA